MEHIVAGFVSEHQQRLVGVQFLERSVPHHHALAGAQAGDIGVYKPRLGAGVHFVNVRAGNGEAGAPQHLLDAFG